MKKYLVIGGEVFSKSGSKHYVNARRLCDLYRVDPKECILLEETDKMMRARTMGLNSMLILRPKYDGNYKIPKIKKKWEEKWLETKKKEKINGKELFNREYLGEYKK